MQNAYVVTIVNPAEVQNTRASVEPSGVPIYDQESEEELSNDENDAIGASRHKKPFGDEDAAIFTNASRVVNNVLFVTVIM